MKTVHISETDSTNRWLREQGGQEDMAVWTDYQTAGRGQGTNRWVSERGKNLLCSLLLHPQDIAAKDQFVVSMRVSLAVCEAVGQHIGDVSIKWPNDIYWRDAKLAGILIEHRLKGDCIRDSIVGIGLNVNQRTFPADIPNPISLWQITEHETCPEQLLNGIIQALGQLPEKDVKKAYMAMLYRRRGFHAYADREGAFMAETVDVEQDGHLVLRDENGRERRYGFKEVTFV